MASLLAPSRKKRLTPEQIGARLAAVSREMERGATVAAACRAAGISVPSYYRWLGEGRLEGRRSARDGDSVRDAVLNAARGVFLTDGFGASVDRVAQVAGYSRQTVYNLFGSKERLFSEVVQSVYRRMIAPILVVEDGAPLAGFLERCARHLLELMLDPDAVGLLRITLGEYREHPELAAAAYAMRTSRMVPNVANLIAGRLDREIAAGMIQPIDTVIAAESFVGSFSAHARHRALVGQAPPPEAELEARLQVAIRLFVRGLGYPETEVAGSS